MSSPGYSSARLRPRRAGLRFTRCAHLTNGPIQERSPSGSDTTFLLLPLLQIASKANLVGLVLHAVDGTKILSGASEQQAWRRASLEEKLKRLDQAIDELMKQTE